MRGLEESNRKKRIRKGIFFLLILAVIWNIFAAGSGSETESVFSFSAYFLGEIQQKVTETVLPFAAFQTAEKREPEGNLVETLVLRESPYIAYAALQSREDAVAEDSYFYGLLLEEQKKAQEVSSAKVAETEEEGEAEEPDEMEELLAAMEAENAAAGGKEEAGEESGEGSPAQVSGNDGSGTEKEPEENAEASEPVLAQNGFQKVLEKQYTYDWSLYPDTASIVKEFYAVDSTTSADAAGIDLEAFLQKDLRIDKNTEGYQILIYHTHSQETFADSVPGDASTSIVGVGERLTQILTQEYGYKVLHHTGEYDVQYRDDAYSKALPAIEQVLKENPEIQVVIDLHRDEVAEGTKLVTDVQGRPTAKFMFFNGLSYTNQTGKIGYLENPNLGANLAFSFQMQRACNEYFPGLTRRIYLKGYRYNMHLKERYLLVELGAQTNTVEEVKNACDPLAQMLDMVLSGMVY